MAKKIGTRTIIVTRTPKVDSLSDDTPDTPDPHEIDGCAVLPRTSFERDKGWIVVDGRQIIAPYGADVLADDKVDVDDLTWQVDGVPGNYEKRNGKPRATIFYLKRQGRGS